jgi:Mg-chelatase subunit ChlD
MLIAEIEASRASLENVLEVLWEVTHFPPALIAFRQLRDNGIKPFPCAVFASCFRAAALRIVPPWITSDHTTILESSRQIFAWLHSLRSETSRLTQANQHLVHRVEITHASSDSDRNQSGRLDHDEYIDIRGLHRSRSTQAQEPAGWVVVSKERVDNVRPEALAFALNGSYESPWNYYFDLPQGVPSLHEHRRVSMLHPADFDNLLQTTNQVDAFKMIGPLRLAECTSATLPVITLDKDGYVSIYDQEDRECSDRHFFTENTITGKDQMPTTDPGQYLLQKLTPIIAKRKSSTTWEVDAWNEDAVTTDTREPQEAIVICVDHSASMAAQMGAGWMPDTSTDGRVNSISRLSEVKEVFQNLVARIAAYKLPTHLGLVTFSGQNSIRINQALTPVLYDFKDRLMETQPLAATAIWDGLEKGKTMLTAFKAQHPNAKLRIIALTDGENNDSRFTAADVCTDLYNNDIVLDAIVIGTDATSELFRMAKHTGGYAFHPKSRHALFQIFLLETFIDIKARPDVVKVPIGNFGYSTPKAADMRDTYDFPPCRPHPNQNDQFIALQDARRYFAAMANRSNRSSHASQVPSSRASAVSGSVSGSVWSGNTLTSGSIIMGAGGNGRLYLNEVKAMIDNPHTYMDVYVSETNMGFWKVVMDGPPSSPYENGTFVLYVELGPEFPRKPPSVRFITPILHNQQT